jgi:peptidoglycan/LPS O-acetylase OafA/YrhL
LVDAFIWFVAVELLGALAFPLAFSLFRRLPDRGYTLTKPLALVLASYLLWILGLTQLVPNSRFTIISILALGAATSGWALYKRRKEILAYLRSEWRLRSTSVLALSVAEMPWSRCRRAAAPCASMAARWRAVA